MADLKTSLRRWRFPSQSHNTNLSPAPRHFPLSLVSIWPLAIAAIIWRPLSSDSSDYSDSSDNDRLQFYLSDRGDRSDHMETTLRRSKRSQRQQKYQDALRTLTLFKMAASTNIEKAINLALFMEEVQKYDCLYNKFSREYRDTWKSTAGKQSERNSIKVLKRSSLSLPSSSRSKNTHNYEKTCLK